MYRMFLTGIIVLVCIITTANPLIADTETVGRFQIFSGEHVISQHDMRGGNSNTSYRPNQIIIKLDTITGDAWILEEENFFWKEGQKDKARFTRGWSKLEKDFSIP